jgi:hypothetical protein
MTRCILTARSDGDLPVIHEALEGLRRLRSVGEVGDAEWHAE